MVKWMDKQPKIVKLLLAIFTLDIAWNIYRIIKSNNKKNLLGVILGLLLLFVGVFFMWIVDIVTIILNNKVIWID